MAPARSPLWRSVCPSSYWKHGVGRVAFDGAPQVPYRLVQVARLPQRLPQVEVGPDAVRLERQRLLEDRDGLGVVAARGERGAQVRVGPPVLRVELDGLPELGDRAGEIRLLREGDTEPVVRLGGARPHLHRAPERDEGPRIVVLAPVGEAERDMRAGIGGITLDRRFELAQGGGSRRVLLALLQGARP